MNMNLPVFAGLILAGGMGRRWGGPKAWARLPGGQTFLSACTAVLAGAGAVPVLATIPPGQTATSSVTGVELYRLPEPGLDMFASFCCGLSRLLQEPDWQAVVVLPVDHPLVHPDTVRTLVAAGPPAVIPSWSGRHGHPICLWREPAEAAVARSPRPANLREVLKAAPAMDVAVDDPGVRINCNTPEALQAGILATGWPYPEL
jgi:CTP:molybdopterin cytidylyltransferase MocA